MMKPQNVQEAQGALLGKRVHVYHKGANTPAILIADLDRIITVTNVRYPPSGMREDPLYVLVDDVGDQWCVWEETEVTVVP